MCFPIDLVFVEDCNKVFKKHLKPLMKKQILKEH